MGDYSEGSAPKHEACDRSVLSPARKAARIALAFPAVTKGLASLGLLMYGPDALARCSDHPRAPKDEAGHNRPLSAEAGSFSAIEAECVRFAPGDGSSPVQTRDARAVGQQAPGLDEFAQAKHGGGTLAQGGGGDHLPFTEEDR